jgi:anaerobic magnesium-protoporphyrin IX monomethyl ester cyclase
MVAEAQFIMGLENETKETIEETYRLAQDWKPDMANWNMYTPWPFAELFEELGDKVQVRDYAKYNFVTPIIQPEGMTRDEVLKGVMKNYARFYMLKSFLSYPWQRDSFKRKYLMGCLKAFAKTTWTKKFYDLERLKFNGVNAQWDLGFDESKVLNSEQIAQVKRDRPDLAADVDFQRKKRVHVPIKVMACGGGDHAAHEDEGDYLDRVDHENNVDHEAALARQ